MVIMGFMVIIKVKMPSEKPLMEKNLFLFILFSTFRIVSSFNILCQEDIRHLCKMASCTLRGKSYGALQALSAVISRFTSDFQS